MYFYWNLYKLFIEVFLYAGLLNLNKTIEKAGMA